MSFFTFEQEEVADIEKLFANVSAQSQLLTEKLSSASVYFNHAFCLPVPIFKFSKDIAAEYAELVFGVDDVSKIQFEHLPVEPGIMNVFTVNEKWLSYLNQRIGKPSFFIILTQMSLKELSAATRAFRDALFLCNFYSSFMIVAVVKDHAFQLIQTFGYETPEDVLYYLLNITQRFQFSADKLTIQISGMIDLDFKLYRELITYFKNVVVEYVHPSSLLLKAGEHPQHYFTPFFNLVK